MNSCIALRAKCASRCEWENSLTVAMLVYASVMRPVMSERASACVCATLPSRGTKYHSVTAYSASQPMKGSTRRRSKAPTTTTIVMK